MKKAIYYLYFGFVPGILCAAGPLRAGVQVTQTGPAHVQLVYEAVGVDWQRDTGRSCLIGLPPQAEVQLEIIQARRAELVEASEAEELRLDGPAYLGQQGWMRDQRVVEVVFAPRREADGRVVVYDRVVVQLHFRGGRSGGRLPEPDRWGEALYRGTVLNYAQARPWRRTRGGGVAKAVVQGSEEQFLRVLVREQGMYRISGRDLEEVGIRLEEVDPARIRLLYGGGRMLSLSPVSTGVELEEIAGVVEGVGDGRFDADDAILFYGEPVSRWAYDKGQGEYTYLKNLYTRDNVYWVGIGGDVPGKRAAVRRGALESGASQVPQSYRERIHQESEALVLLQTFGIKSGYDWYWEDFQGNARNYSTFVQEAVDEPVDIRLRFFGVKDKDGVFPVNRFEVRWNDETISQVSFNEATPIVALQASGGVQEGLNQLGLFHSGTAVRLDWYELEYSRGFSAQRGELIFDSPVFEGIGEFHLKDFVGERPRIFEFSEDLAEIQDFVHDAGTGTVAFQDGAGGVPRHYLAVGPSRWKRPLRLELARPGRLQAEGRGADYLVIVHPDFVGAAERLAAWRAQDDRFGPPLRTAVVDVQDIYDEFSGGLLDPAALRNFLKYTAGHWNPLPLFVVLFGDGSYDYKNNSGISPGNWIPPFQNGDSTYDEWYVRVTGDDDMADMAIGRLTVQTGTEADVVVDKLIEYDRQPEPGPWQSRVLLVADDLLNPSKEDILESFFLQDAEFLTVLMPGGLDLVKHYLAQFPLEGRTKPRARDEFIRLFNEGALILTYVGHGNPETLAHEQMFVLSRDLGAIANGRRLPLVYTAASQVGVFDDPVRDSMPEAFLKMPDGGVIGMISATRIGYHASNMLLARQFHNQMYHSGREHVPVGLALMEAKRMMQGIVDSRGRKNIRRYSLFGDPAMRLARPRYKVVIDMPDTLQALEEVHLQGRVFDASGQPATQYSGRAWVQAFDSSAQARLDHLFYERTGGPLFRGVFPVDQGRFQATFRVPKDITYRSRKGRLSTYLWGAGWPAAFGSAERLALAGTAEGVTADQQGPDITIGFVGQEGFESGDAVSPRSVLEVVIRDASGINVTGETGHEIALSIDATVFKITDFFTSSAGDYRQGRLEYPLPALAPGEYVLGLKAWDTFNNSARVEVAVQVEKADDGLLPQVLFYPNPMQEGGHFTYSLSAPAEVVRIRVFSVGGKLVDELEGQLQPGYNQVEWKPAADLANGSYLYRIQVRGEDGKAAERAAVVQVMK